MFRNWECPASLRPTKLPVSHLQGIGVIGVTPTLLMSICTAIWCRTDFFDSWLRLLPDILILTQFMTQTGSRNIDSDSAHDSSGFHKSWFRLNYDSSGFQKCWFWFDSWLKRLPKMLTLIQLMTQAKSLRLWVDSWFDSESYPCLVVTQILDITFV